MDTEENKVEEPIVSDGRKWYAIRTITGHEKRVKSYLDSEIPVAGLQDKIFQVLIPEEKVFEVKKLEAGYRAYWKYGASQGPHACIELSMPGLKYLDRQDTWIKDFDEVHGEGAYDLYIEDLNMCVERTQTYDELVKFRSDLSSDY
jgi:transcription antitermination factor NusG